MSKPLHTLGLLRFLSILHKGGGWTPRVHMRAGGFGEKTSSTEIYNVGRAAIH